MAHEALHVKVVDYVTMLTPLSALTAYVLGWASAVIVSVFLGSLLGVLLLIAVSAAVIALKQKDDRESEGIAPTPTRRPPAGT